MGGYALGAMLGRGSFAVVWRGRHATTGAVVAVKEINTGALNAKLRQSLECEVSILQRVEHRNIVRLHETLEVPRPALAASRRHVLPSRVSVCLIGASVC